MTATFNVRLGLIVSFQGVGVEKKLRNDGICYEFDGTSYTVNFEDSYDASNFFKEMKSLEYPQIICIPDSTPDFMDGYQDDMIPKGKRFDRETCAAGYDDAVREAIEKKYPDCYFEWINSTSGMEVYGVDERTVRDIMTEVFIDGEKWIEYEDDPDFGVEICECGQEFVPKNGKTRCYDCENPMREE